MDPTSLVREEKGGYFPDGVSSLAHAASLVAGLFRAASSRRQEYVASPVFSASAVAPGVVQALACLVQVSDTGAVSGLAEASAAYYLSGEASRFPSEARDSWIAPSRRDEKPFLPGVHGLWFVRR